MSVETLDPALIWGLVPRIVGFIYVMAFGALILQHSVMPGADGLLPMAPLRQRMARDFPGFRRFLYLPTLLWISDSDATQRHLNVVGVLGGLAAIYGGPIAPYALVVCWMVWLSLESRGLLFPWDTMLQEVGFLVLFLPSVQALPELSATTPPLPSVRFMVQWLVLRLMLGFGKDKFFMTRRSDFLYLRGFFVWMPLPNPIGWLAHHAPPWFLRLGLLFMFLAEIVAPVLGLFAGMPRLIAFGFLVTLMFAIQATGNWGFFNVGYGLLCVCLLDTQASIFDLADPAWASSLTSFPGVVVHAVMLLLFMMSLFYLPNNSWGCRSWVHWQPDMFAISPDKVRIAKLIHRMFEPLRWLAPFRLVNGYGVFPPHSAPPIRFTPVFEGSDDGVHWKQYGYRHMPSFPHDRPPFIAPYHARLDQWTYYVTMCMDSSALCGSLFPMSNPYAMYTRVTMFDLLVQRILEHDQNLLGFLGHNPFPDRAPKLVRVGVLALTPTRPSELRTTGRWWHVRRVCTLHPARGLASWPSRVFIPEPEVFHPDLVVWKGRARSLRGVVAAFERGEPIDQAVLAHSDLTRDDLTRFWDELVPMLKEEFGDWSRVEDRADEIEAKFGIEGLFRLERVLERYAWLLRHITEPHRFGRVPPAIETMSNFRYHMVMHQMVLDGPEAIASLIADPSRVVARAATSTRETELWTLCLFRRDQFMALSRFLRATQLGNFSGDRLPSIFEYYRFLVGLSPRGEEFVPKYTKHPNGEYTIEGFYPPPPLLPARAPVMDGSREAAE